MRIWVRSIPKSVLLWLLLLGLYAAPSAGAVEVDTMYSVAADSNGVTFQMHIGGNDRLLLVFVATEGGTPVMEVSYLGSSLSYDSSWTHTNGGPRVELWSLANPGQGNHSLKVGLSASDKFAVTAISLAEVDQSDPFNHLTIMEASSSEPAMTVASAVGNLVVDFEASRSADPPIVGTGQTELGSIEIGGAGVTNHFAAASSEPGNSSVEMRWMTTDSSDWVQLGVDVHQTTNNAPVLAAIGAQTVDENQLLSFGVSATDPDSDSLILSASGMPSGALFGDNFDGTGAFSWTPADTLAGNYLVTFYASDGTALDSEVVSITVNNVNQAPVLDPIGPRVVGFGEAIVFNTQAKDDASIPVMTAHSLPSGATYIDSGNGTATFSWKPSLLQAGSHNVTFIATDDEMAADSEVVTISIVLDLVKEIQIQPDSAVITADSTIQFKVYVLDDLGGLLSTSDATWSLTDTLGTIDSGGNYDPDRVGVLRVIANASGYVDTSAYLRVIPGKPVELVVSPDSTNVGIGDTVQFIAESFDAEGNAADAGIISWGIRGHIGSISDSGQFIGIWPGDGQVSATSSIGSLADSSSSVAVDELYLTTISIGNSTVHPADTSESVLAFHIENYFSTSKYLTGLTARANFRGPGIQTQRLSQVTGFCLYWDRDNDSLITPADSLLASENAAATVDFSFDSLEIKSDSGQTLLLNVTLGDIARDGDTLDLYLYPATDITVEDGTVVAGPDSANSFGYTVIDGMVKHQIGSMTIPDSTIENSKPLQPVMAFIIPKNGYSSDTLRSIQIENLGTATTADLDSLMLFADNANLAWNTTASEKYVGKLVFTGASWVITGLHEPLTSAQNGFFVVADLNSFPTNGHTFALHLPLNGVQVQSGNDGPIDLATLATDTVKIITDERIAVETVEVNATILIPGQLSGSLANFSLQNGYVEAVELDSLDLSLVMEGDPVATQPQLDSQIDSLMLYLRPSVDGAPDDQNDSLLAVAYPSAGRALFRIDGLGLEGLGKVAELTVKATMSLPNCKNGNTVNVSLDDQTKIYLSESKIIEGDFPLTNPRDHEIAAFVAASVTLNPGGPTSLFGGQTNQILLDFELPGNGYSNDILQSISLINNGTLNMNQAVSALKLWLDALDDGFNGNEALIGQFTAGAGSYSLVDLLVPLSSSGTRFIVTANILDKQFEVGTIRMGIPVDGCRYTSGTEGPLDLSVVNGSDQVVFPSDRITVISIPRASVVVRPGQQNSELLTFALYNGYATDAHTLRAVTLSNATHTASSSGFADQELGQVSLYFDSDKNRTFDNDSLVAVGLLESGQLQLSGQDILLPAESLSYFFVVADLSEEAIDSDSLAVSIESPSSFTFDSDVNVNGDLPLSSGGYLIVDGSIGDQYEILPVAPRTLTPGDTSIVVMAFRSAHNGDLPDLLEGAIIENTGDADDNDMNNFRLWVDANDDDSWQDSDSLLGNMTYAAGRWSVGGLSWPVTQSTEALFITADVDSAAALDVVFQARIPSLGVSYQSSNDGPNDTTLVSTGVFTISSSGLRVENLAMPQTYSVGQTIEISYSVTNITAGAIPGVIGEVVSISDSTVVTLDSSTAGPVMLNPDEQTTFSFYYTAAQPGATFWRLRAMAPTVPDSSATISTESITVQSSPSNVEIKLTNSIPTAVTKGQSNVFPMSISYKHPDTASTSASLRLDSLAISSTDGQSAPQAADLVFSRMALSSGAITLAVRTSMPSSSQVWLVFNSPLIVAPGEEQQLALLVDIDTAATATQFALQIASAASIELVDHNTLMPVSLAPTVTFPMSTATCRIDEPSQSLATSSRPLLGTFANYGQTGLGLVRLDLRHPGQTGSSLVQLSRLRFSLRDQLGVAIPASDLMDETRLYRGNSQVGQLVTSGLNDTIITVNLSSPLTLGPGEIDSLDIRADLKTSSAVTAFELVITDSTALTVRDLSSGAQLVAATDTLVLSTGTAFPMLSGLANMKLQATAPDFCVTSSAPATVAGGVDSLGLLALDFAYSQSSSYSGLRLYYVLIGVQDSTERPLDPDLLFDRIGCRLNGSGVTYQPFVQLMGGSVQFVLSDTGLVIDPGDTVNITLVGDIEADVPFDHFQLAIQGTSSVSLKDATDSLNLPGLFVASGCINSLPFTSAITEIFLAAGQPLLSSSDNNVILGYPGQTDVLLWSGELDYQSEMPLGDVSINALRGRMVKRSSSSMSPANLASLFSNVRWYINDDLQIADSALVGDSLSLEADSAYNLSRGQVATVEVVADILPTVANGNYRLVFDDSLFLDISDQSLATTIFVASGIQYPLLGRELSIQAENLENSFTNYPNPFNPSRGDKTTIGYVLPDNATVDIEIFTLTGDLVKAVVRDGIRSAGPNQIDYWTGLNDGGSKVIPGTYFCQITARYSSGKSETYRRKIAIVR